LSFQAIDEPCYVSADEQVRIQKESEVRLRIVGIRNDANEIFCVATLKDNYLGLIANSWDE
jgi:DNA-directed RNA polymerase II subunit RPB7